MDNSTLVFISKPDLFIMNNSSPSSESTIAARSASLIFIALLSCFGNFLVCVTLYRRPYLLTPSNKLVFSLTTSNFVFSLLVLPFIIVGSVTEQWYFGKVWCAITGFLTLLVMGASLLILAAIACDRYYAIVHPMLYPSIITGFRATVVIIICWVIAGICAAPPLFGSWSRYEFQPARCACLPVWQYELGYTIFWFALCFFTPYTLMICCYGFIFKVARTKTRQVHSRLETPSKFASNISDESSSQSSDSGSFTEMSDSFPTTRVIGVNMAVTTQQAPNGKIKTEVISNDLTDNASSTLEDSGVIMSENVPPVTNGQVSKEEMKKNDAECGKMFLPNQVENKDSPKSRGQTNPGIAQDQDMPSTSQIEAEFQLRNSRKSSNASIVSSTSQVLRRTSLAFSAVKYYSNQMKAVFTIAFILGILLLTMGPFIVIAFIEAVTETTELSDTEPTLLPPSPVARATLSISTCFMFLTCVYYPLIYGLWNRTVRKEMKQLLCGRRNEHHPLRKTRILSLTTHIQDLGMSPGLTAAIIGESDPVSFHDNFFRGRHLRASSRHLRSSKENSILTASKRRHTLHSLSSGSLLPQAATNVPSPIVTRHRHNGLPSHLRREKFEGHANIGVIAEESDDVEDSGAVSTRNNFSNNSNMRRWRHDYGVKTVSMALEENDKAPPSTTQSSQNGGYKMRIQTKDDVLVPVQYEQPRKELEKVQNRAREKPATRGLLELSSAEVLNSPSLSSALLFAGYDHRRRQIPPPPACLRTLSDPGASYSSEKNPEEADPPKQDDLAQALGNMPVSKQGKNSVDHTAVRYETGDDKISMMTEGRLHGSNLIHLKPGEPSKLMEWSSNQFVDFFASSVAYGVVEAGKVKLKEEEKPNRS